MHRPATLLRDFLTDRSKPTGHVMFVLGRPRAECLPIPTIPMEPQAPLRAWEPAQTGTERLALTLLFPQELLQFRCSFRIPFKARR